MLNKYINSSDAELLDLLVKYTDEYSQMLKDEYTNTLWTDEYQAICKQEADEIAEELKLRKEMHITR